MTLIIVSWLSLVTLGLVFLAVYTINRCEARKGTGEAYKCQGCKHHATYHLPSGSAKNLLLGKCQYTDKYDTSCKCQYFIGTAPLEIQDA